MVTIGGASYGDVAGEVVNCLTAKLAWMHAAPELILSMCNNDANDGVRATQSLKAAESQPLPFILHEYTAAIKARGEVAERAERGSCVSRTEQKVRPHKIWRVDPEHFLIGFGQLLRGR